MAKHPFGRVVGECKYCGAELTDYRDFCNWQCRNDFKDAMADDAYDRAKDARAEAEYEAECEKADHRYNLAQDDKAVEANNA